MTENDITLFILIDGESSSVAAPPPPPASINYAINHVISRANLQRVTDASLQALEWGQ